MSGRAAFSNGYVYRDLQAVARRMFAARGRGDLQTTALVNEVFLRLERADCVSDFANRKVFFSVAAKAKKQALIDHYRRRQKAIEQHSPREPLDDIIDEVELVSNVSILELTDELNRLEIESPRQHAVIMHRFFGGRSAAETAAVLEVSEGTVHRDWRIARAKLFRRLRR